MSFTVQRASAVSQSAAVFCVKTEYGCAGNSEKMGDGATI